MVINHPHTPERAAAVVAAIQAAGGSALAIAADISDRAEYQAMYERQLGIARALPFWDHSRDDLLPRPQQQVVAA